MRYQSLLALLLAPILGPYAHASVSEVEPNSTVIGAGIYQTSDPLFRYVREIDNTGAFNDTANEDPSLATPLSKTDEMVGQLSSTRDYDWYYIDISDSDHPVTPVYFGCDKKFGYYHEGPEEFTVSDQNTDVYWQLEYYYDNDPSTPAGVARQSSYVVYPDICKRGTSETKGPMRFQMNTQRPGRYYVRVWGRLIATPVEKADFTVTINGQKETGKTHYDEIVVPTADYTLRVYTDRISGELEPNDGMIEAYALTSGVTVPAQLASMYDQDWFYIDNDISRNTAKKLPFYFNCKGQTGAVYILSAYNQLGVLQSNYEVQAEQCNGSSGFSFTIDAPESARYYFVVSSPTYSENDQFTQSDYSVLVIAGSSESNTPPDVPTRLPGDLEPNDTLINAFPLTGTEKVVAQLASPADLDYYYYETVAVQNSSGSVPIYFGCNLPDTSTVLYSISYFNSQGVLQKSYTVGAPDCSIQPKTDGTGSPTVATGGFKFDMRTPAAGKYYILVASSAAQSASDTFSDADYTLSTFLDIATQTSPTTIGNLRTANIADNAAANRDNFTINLNRCGPKGTVKLAGKKLNLSGVDPSSQVLVQIGQWSCLSDAKELFLKNPGSANKSYVYPKPPEPAPKPVKKPKLVGG